jgi:type II secretion system protein G
MYRNIAQVVKKHLSQAGFTLMEIMVVIAIIGVLATMIAGNFIEANKKSRDAQRKSNMTQVKNALEAYYNDHGSYPASNGGEILGAGWGERFQDLDIADGAVYMAQLPTDPRAPSIQYFYHTDTNATKYQLFTYLENERDDGIVTFDPVRTCGTATCNYAISSSNTTIQEDLQ